MRILPRRFYDDLGISRIVVYIVKRGPEDVFCERISPRYSYGSVVLPDFPFTVILPIYDILDLYSFIGLRSKCVATYWKAVLSQEPCKVASILLSTKSNHPAGALFNFVRFYVK